MRYRKEVSFPAALASHDALTSGTFMPRTYDETIYNRVMARRREFRCVLGGKPEWQQEQLGEAEAEIPIPSEMVDRLQVDLGPKRRIPSR